MFCIFEVCRMFESVRDRWMIFEKPKDGLTRDYVNGVFG